MAALTDLSDLINRATGGSSGTPQNVSWFKSARINGAAATANIAGRPATLWTYDGHPGGGSTPALGAAICTNATVGALPFTNPGGSRQSWLTQAWATGLVGGTLILYDRLLHTGGLSGALSGGQSVQGSPASPALTRNTGGLGNFIMLEINSIIGSTNRTVSADYTNELGTSGRTTAAVAIGNTGFREQTRAILLPLQAGDKGVRAVNTVTLSGTTGTAGNISAVIGKPVAYIGIGTAGAPGWRDYVTGLPGIPELEADSCLSLLWFPATTTAPELFGGYSIVEA